MQKSQARTSTSDFLLTPTLSRVAELTGQEIPGRQPYNPRPSEWIVKLPQDFPYLHSLQNNLLTFLSSLYLRNITLLKRAKMQNESYARSYSASWTFSRAVLNSRGQTSLPFSRYRLIQASAQLLNKLKASLSWQEAHAGTWIFLMESFYWIIMKKSEFKMLKLKYVNNKIQYSNKSWRFAMLHEWVLNFLLILCSFSHFLWLYVLQKQRLTLGYSPVARQDSPSESTINVRKVIIHVLWKLIWKSTRMSFVMLLQNTLANEYFSWEKFSWNYLGSNWAQYFWWPQVSS